MRISGQAGPVNGIFDPTTGVLLGYRNRVSGDDIPLVHHQVGTLASVSGVLPVDVGLGQYFTLALSENITSWTFANLPPAGYQRRLSILITQNASAKTVAWPSSFKWIGGSAGAVSVGSGALDVLDLVTFDGGANWLVLALSKAYA